MTTTARITTTGGTQHVSLPPDVHFEADEVCVKRIGAAVLLFPKNAAWDLFAAALGRADDDFMRDRDQWQHERRKAI